MKYLKQRKNSNKKTPKSTKKKEIDKMKNDGK